LLTDYITSESRIVIRRNIQNRAVAMNRRTAVVEQDYNITLKRWLIYGRFVLTNG
jgi:hypothetical protein